MKDRRKRRKVQNAQRKMNRKLDQRLQEDMPPCSFPECPSQSTHLIMTKASLAVFNGTRDRQDIKMWGGCDEHQQVIAYGVKSQGIDVQVATARALAHLGEIVVARGEGVEEDDSGTAL